MLLNPGTAGQVLVTNPNDPRLPVHNHSSARQYYAPDLALLDFPTAPLAVIISGAPTCPASAPLCPHECDPGIGDKKKKCIRRVTVRAASADYATLAPIVDKVLVESQVGGDSGPSSAAPTWLFTFRLPQKKTLFPAVDDHSAPHQTGPPLVRKLDAETHTRTHNWLDWARIAPSPRSPSTV